MFRRFGTPFAVDWLAKNVNGYVYTTAIPADPDLRIEATEYSSRYGARVPRDAAFATTMGAYLDTVLPVYGRDFADWWRDRLRPGDGAQLRLPRGAARCRRRDGPGRRRPACSRTPSTSTIATGRSTGCSTSPSCRRRSTCARSWRRPAAAVDETLLGRLQNSASDRNWDSIEALWRMKNEVRDDAELRAAFAPDDADEIAAALARERPRPAVHRRADRAVPARVRLARRLEPRVHLPDRPRADGAGPRARPRLPRHRLRLPERDRGDAPRHRGRLARDPRGADRRGARGDARRPTRSTCGWRRSRPTTTSTSTRARTPTCASSCSRSAGSSSRPAGSTSPTT